MLDLSQNGFFHLQAQGGDTTGGFDIFSNGLLDKDTFDYMLELKRMITAGDRTGLVGAMAYYAKVIAGFCAWLILRERLTTICWVKRLGRLCRS